MMKESLGGSVPRDPAAQCLPVQEVRPSPVGVDGGEALQTAGEVRGERRLADVLQALQLPNQNPGKVAIGDICS